MHSLTFMIPSKVGVDPSRSNDLAAPGVAASAFVVLDNLRGAHLGLVRIAAKFAQAPALAQKVPAAVELNIDRIEARLLGIGYDALGVEFLFFSHKLLDMGKDGPVGNVLYHDASPRVRLAESYQREIANAQRAKPLGRHQGSL